jgi:hypothetical protein
MHWEVVHSVEHGYGKQLHKPFTKATINNQQKATENPLFEITKTGTAVLQP